jgi:hypothetical protein
MTFCGRFSGRCKSSAGGVAKQRFRYRRGRFGGRTTLVQERHTQMGIAVSKVKSVALRTHDRHDREIDRRVDLFDRTAGE